MGIRCGDVLWSLDDFRLRTFTGEKYGWGGRVARGDVLLVLSYDDADGGDVRVLTPRGETGFVFAYESLVSSTAVKSRT